MLSSAIRQCSDPDDYADCVRGTRAELTITARGQFFGEVTRIDLYSLWLQRFSENLPRVAHAALPSDRAIFAFVTRPDGCLTAGGLELGPSRLIQHVENRSYYQRIYGPTAFGAMSLPLADMALLGETYLGRDLLPPADAVLLTVPTAAMALLLGLHAEAGRLARETPDILANPDAARGLEQSLLQALLRCLDRGTPEADSAANRQHDKIMRRFRQLLDDSPDQPIYVPDLCAKIGVSDRTFRRCCEEQLGLPPRRFLLRRRMQLVHRALCHADAGETTVTIIAMRYGFWELGRFEGAYAQFYGEMPSHTLQREPSDGQQAENNNASAEGWRKFGHEVFAA